MKQRLINNINVSQRDNAQSDPARMKCIDDSIRNHSVLIVSIKPSKKQSINPLTTELKVSPDCDLVMISLECCYILWCEVSTHAVK